jgi:hypothetical protein
VAFPSPTATVPTLSAYQISFNGLVMGAGASGIEIKEIDGLDVEAVRSGDAARARDRGEFAGLDLLGGRDITVKVDLSTIGASSFGAALQALAAVMIPAGATEAPWFINLPFANWGTLACMARPRTRAWKIDIPFAFGGLSQDQAPMWHATDPLFYSTPTSEASCTLATITDKGFTFPFTFPLSFGGAESPSSITIDQGGNIDCRPILVITGPVTKPSISNSSLPNNPTITFDVTLSAGEQLVVDTDLGTALIYVPGTSVGSPAASTLVAGSQWWSLYPGTNVINYNASATAGGSTLTLQYANAWLL